MVFLIALVICILLNFYILIFGKSDFDKFRNKLSIKKYIRELNKTLDESFDETTVLWGKLFLGFCSLILIIINLWFCLQILIAIPIGIYLSKVLIKVPKISNVINKFAVYISKLRNAK